MPKAKKTNAAARRMKTSRVPIALFALALAGGAALLVATSTRTARHPAQEIVAASSAPLPPPKPSAAPPAVPKPAPAPSPAPVPPAKEAEADPAPVAAAPMSAALETALDNWLIVTYRQCWKAPTAPSEGEPYFPKIRVAFKSDGALRAAPRLVNPPSDPAWRPQADAALRAVKACDPLHVPEKYAPYYQQWKTKTVYFDTARP
jgi:hypothetical protein